MKAGVDKFSALFALKWVFVHKYRRYTCYLHGSTSFGFLPHTGRFQYGNASCSRFARPAVSPPCSHPFLQLPWKIFDISPPHARAEFFSGTPESLFGSSRSEFWCCFSGRNFMMNQREAFHLSLSQLPPSLDAAAKRHTLQPLYSIRQVFMTKEGRHYFWCKCLFSSYC